MNIHSNIGRDQYTSKRQIMAWSRYSDPFMVVLSEQPQFLALEVIIAHLASYGAGSRQNAFLRAHGWTKNYLNSRQGSEHKVLRGLTKYLSGNPKQVALLLKDTDHIFISREDRVARLQRANRHFDGRDATQILDMIECYQNAVEHVEEERRYDATMAAARERTHLEELARQEQKRLAKLHRLVERVRAMKANRTFTEVLDVVKSLLGLNTKATGKVFGVDLRHWRYLVSPLE